MAMRLFIKEGGDVRLPNEPRGFSLELRADGTNSVLLYTVQVNRIDEPNTHDYSYVISEREPDKSPTPVLTRTSDGPALRKAFKLVIKKALDYQASYQIPVMYQDTSPGEGNVVRNLETFMPVLTFE